MDHFRGEFAKFDRKWEDRWIRDMGYNRLIQLAMEGLLKKYGLRMSDFTKVVYDCQDAGARKKLNKVFGISPEMEQDTLQTSIGHCGTAQSLVMMAAALDQAKPHDRILLLSFGSGCDALVFEVTEDIARFPGSGSMKKQLNKKVELDHYEKYLVWRDILPVNTGLRSEEDLWTRPSVLWRHREEVLGLRGSRCLKCGTPQYPAQRVCVNPQCGAIDQMESYSFADKTGRIFSYTGDMLAASPNPPTSYGAVEFEGGGKNYFEFADCNLEDLATGTKVAMSFRRKYKDEKRGVSGYFWKATPIREDK